MLQGAKMFAFGRITLFCLEKRLSKHKMTICSKNLGRAMTPLVSPLLRLCLIRSLPKIIFYSNQFFLRKMLGTWYGPVGTRFL